MRFIANKIHALIVIVKLMIECVPEIYIRYVTMIRR